MATEFDGMFERRLRGSLHGATAFAIAQRLDLVDDTFLSSLISVAI